MHFSDGSGNASSPWTARNTDSLARFTAARTTVRSRLLQLATTQAVPTILLDALTDELIDQCAESLDAGTWKPLERWAATVCYGRHDLEPISRLFSALNPALQASLGDTRVQAPREILEAIVERSRTGSDFADDRVDDIDVLLGDVVAKVESKDPMTAEHCRAVSAWCARIANRLAMPRAQALEIARGGLIHDLGKSKIPAEILRAPRRLTADEWRVMATHPVVGHDMLRAEPKLRTFTDIVRLHHERFDGTGYPDHIDGTRIPISVRIVSVADSFNAMIGRRPYRAPMPPDRALAELQRCAGTQFDPTVVEAMIGVVTCS